MNRTVVYSCPFVPAEWIAAHGFEPSRILPSSSDSASSMVPVPGVCPYCRVFIGSAAKSGASLVVVTTVCDQMRRAADELTLRGNVPVFLLNVPHTWQTAAARQLYVSELERLGRTLVRLGGESPSPEKLADVALEYDAARRVPNVQSVPRGIPIALIGGPAMRDALDLYKVIEEHGGFVALDGTETGERGLPAPYDVNRLRNDPLDAIADAYFGSIVDPFRRPNDRLFDWLKDKCAERGIRAVILRRYIWCDNWHAESERIREALGLPFLNLDVAGDGRDGARMQTRVQALLEVLR